MGGFKDLNAGVSVGLGGVGVGELTYGQLPTDSLQQGKKLIYSNGRLRQQDFVRSSTYFKGNWDIQEQADGTLKNVGGLRQAVVPELQGGFCLWYIAVFLKLSLTSKLLGNRETTGSAERTSPTVQDQVRDATFF